MKHAILRMGLTALVALVSAASYAYDACINGIYYNFSGTEATVTCLYRSSASNISAYTGDVTIPNSVNYNGKNYNVKKIDNDAFYRCSNLTSITLSHGIEHIGIYSFEGCSNLTNVIIPESVTYIGSYAFEFCTNLTNILIPESVKAINYRTFYGCSKLADITIQEGLTYIGEEAFRGCNFSDITIPSTVTKIGENAFYGCPNFKSVRFSSIESLCKIEFSSASGNPLSVAHHLYIGNEDEEIQNVIIPSTITNIGNYTFYGSDLKNVTIPSSVTNIGQEAFYCNELEKCLIESLNPATIGSKAFTSFTTICVPDEAVITYNNMWADYSNLIIPQSRLEYYVAKTTAADGHSELLKAIGGIGKESDIVSLKVEGSINGYDIMLMRNKMTNLRYLDLSDASIVAEKDNYEYYTGYYTTDNEIGDYSFYQLDKLRSVVLPKNITYIGKYAFAYCENLIEITGMPTSCTKIGKRAFASSKHLTNFEFGQKLNVIPEGCFAYSKINSVTLPNSVTNIEEKAFYKSELKSIKLGTEVKNIGKNAFESCNSLESIIFNNNLETIEDYAFSGCPIIELRLPPSLKKIGFEAFDGDFTEIHIPSMIESIADQAFSWCRKAKDIYVYTLEPTNIKQNSFIYDGVTLHAPQEPEDVFWAYYNDTQWSQFTNVVPFEAKYEKWYTGEDQDITLGDGETIPNEDEDEKAEGEMRPGSCLEYLQGAYQWLNKLVMKWVGDKFPCLIDNSSVFIDELCFELDIKAGKWYFFSFPFNVDLSKCIFNGKYVWRYYDGDLRAKNGGGAWQNVTDGKLKAFQGYIFNAQKAGKITISINDPMFTGSNKRVNIAAHASSEAQNAGWNFVGNPFTSYYDLSNFIDEFDAPITVWDPVNNTYNAIVPGDDDYEFHPFEAFFVQKPEGQSNITFSKDGREGYNDAMRTLQSRRRARAAQAINPKRRIVNLEISDGTTSDKTRVVFNDERQMKYEPECDASKFMSEESAVQLFTIDNDDVRYAINERPNAEGIVQLGFIAKADGRYTISAARLDKAMALKDNETGTIHNLAEGDYEFLAEAGTNVDRFVLMPEQQTTGISELLAEGIKIEVQDGGINIAGIEGKTVNIYNAAGQLVATLTESGRTEVSVGAYVVKIGEVSTKIVVR